MSNLPIEGIFAVTTLLALIAIELGYRWARNASRKGKGEQEAPVSAIVGAILALLAFVLAFTFGIVSNRYDTRKSLVRDQANAIRTAWTRDAVLPEPDRTQATGLIKQYLDLQLKAVASNNADQINAMRVEGERIQRQLLDNAYANYYKGMNSDIAAMYIEALNDTANVNATRVAVALQDRSY